MQTREVILTLFYPAIQFVGFIFIQHSLMNFGASFSDYRMVNLVYYANL